MNASPPIDEMLGEPLRRRASAVARQRAFELRSDGVTGDNVWRVPVQEIDRAELSTGGGRHD